MEGDRAKEEAKLESQQTTIITREDIVKKQAKSVEDVIFSETGVSRTVDAMGRVGASIRGAEPRHTLILVDGQAVMGDFAKYYGAGDELLRQGTENVERIEIIRGAASAKYGSDAIGGVINIITRKPAKTAGLEVNVEGRRIKGDSDIFPYQNIFLRADSGQMGKVRTAIFGSKRDIMPIHDNSDLKMIDMGVLNDVFTTDVSNYKNSLRYYGTMNSLGMSTEYDINAHNTLAFNMNRYTEDLRKETRHTNLVFEPFQKFKRTATRDTYGLAWQGNNQGNTDWNVELNYARMKEDDIALTSDYQKSIYEGKNTLNYVDDIDHRQYDFKASANTQVNDNHMLTYGVSYTYEKGEGSRLKNAPNTTRRAIDPWDYDKSLHVDAETGKAGSAVHDSLYEADENGVLKWNSDKEYYNADSKSQAPSFGYDLYTKYFGKITSDSSYSSIQEIYDTMPAADKEKIDSFSKQLAADPANANNNAVQKPAYSYQAALIYYKNSKMARLGEVKLNGKTFKEVYDSLINQQTVGQASIRKQSVFLQDTWQINKNTILSPIIRLDHSSLFGSTVTANMGLTHNLAGNPHRRLKANFGTGYTEPGMGELYYNWEMYGGSAVGMSTSRLGWYWVGNKDLQPEKSVNMDLFIEGENENTTARAGIFYNRIRNYMTTYFTGALMDFHPEYEGYRSPPGDLSIPDMIYSFKNIGRAEITGVEASVEQKLGSKWTAKLGYTWLNAINKSDSDMPRQLLDKPQHKVDIGISYDDKASGWSGSLWGDYYINMLDSNSVAGNGNYLAKQADGTWKPQFAEGGKQTYEKKTYGIWNVIVQKQLGKDARVYFGVDNLFNHHDYDRALQERVYKVGLNMKFGYDARSAAKKAIVQKAWGNDSPIMKELRKGNRLEGFIQAPFDTTKESGVEIIGDYRARWTAFGGTNRPAATVTADSIVGDAAKNVLDKSNHGFEQRLRLGIDARIGDNTNVKVLGSMSGAKGVDTMHDIADSQGLNHQRLENMDVTQHADKWDFSIGRLTEPMGVTGYWFGKEYDGGRAVWTSGRSQVRLGYGDFSHSTGVSDSAYTHATRQTYYRAPTMEEFWGLNFNQAPHNMTTEHVVEGNTSGNIQFYQQLKNAKTVEEKMTIMKHMWQLATQAYGNVGYPNTIDDGTNSSTLPPGYVAFDGNPYMNVAIQSLPSVYYTYTDSTGTHNKNFSPTFYDTDGSNTQVSFKGLLDFNTMAIDNRNGQLFDGSADASGQWNSPAFTAWYEKNEAAIVNAYKQGLKNILPAGSSAGTWTDYKGQKIDIEDTIKKGIYDTMYGMTTIPSKDKSVSLPGMAAEAFEDIGTFIQWQEDFNRLPRGPLGEAAGLVIKTIGTVLQRDTIPPMDRAAFIQAKHALSKNLGIQAWWLRSVGDDTHRLEAAHGDTNDIASFDQLANVIGIGAKWAIGDNAAISFDYGQNRTDFARYMNGATKLNHIPYSSVADPNNPFAAPVVTKEHFDFAGRDNGGVPHFWVARVDIGKSDTDKPGSWNAFADYKYFQHGSFFGGNGTEGVPDRYLDGIKSFTVGGGYVPAKDILLEAFYTFDAKGIGKRDTLYGSENFSLGDYTRIQATFRF